MNGQLVLRDGTKFEGQSFGYEKSVSGEVVFSTGMVGYPESLTDPSYLGQILIFTYPLIGNYGVPKKSQWESGGIKVQGLIVSDYIDTPSHFQSEMTLSEWLKNEKIPGLEIKDTRYLAQKIRSGGVLLGKIQIKNQIDFYDPDKENLVRRASIKKITTEGQGNKTILLLDCGAKRNIVRCLLAKGVKIITIPWNYDPFANNLRFDGIVISNGPGNPKMAAETINNVKKTLSKKIPTLGICLGNQILALAAGGNTYKLKFGHRSQNQPCILSGSKRCFITTQNHGFAVGKMPKGFKEWFVNANDGTNEGIIHEKYPFMSVQFHPEANPGPTDTDWIFDKFLSLI